MSRCEDCPVHQAAKGADGGGPDGKGRANGSVPVLHGQNPVYLANHYAVQTGWPGKKPEKKTAAK